MFKFNLKLERVRTKLYKKLISKGREFLQAIKQIPLNSQVIFLNTKNQLIKLLSLKFDKKGVQVQIEWLKLSIWNIQHGLCDVSTWLVCTPRVSKSVNGVCTQFNAPTNSNRVCSVEWSEHNGLYLHSHDILLDLYSFWVEKCPAYLYCVLSCTQHYKEPLFFVRLMEYKIKIRQNRILN